MGEAVVVLLRRNELGQGRVGHARRGIGVKLGRGVVLGTQIRGCEGSDGGAKAVSDNNQVVVRVRIKGFLDRLGNGVADVLPGAPEAQLSFTAVTEMRISVRELYVGNPVADRVRSANRQDDYLVSVVDCNVASGIRGGGAVRVRNGTTVCR